MFSLKKTINLNSHRIESIKKTIITAREENSTTAKIAITSPQLGQIRSDIYLERGKKRVICY